MVITGSNMIHVGRGLDATHSVIVPEAASKAIAPQDALTDSIPVGRETGTSIRTGPLRHSAIPALDVDNGASTMYVTRQWTRGSSRSRYRY
jgi:hypothetical protein